ncbi:hypothetical protein HDU67_004156, partial [Dinochytrium kinnereticum]
MQLTAGTTTAPADDPIHPGGAAGMKRSGKRAWGPSSRLLGVARRKGIAPEPGTGEGPVPKATLPPWVRLHSTCRKMDASLPLQRVGPREDMASKTFRRTRDDPPAGGRSAEELKLLTPERSPGLLTRTDRISLDA